MATKKPAVKKQAARPASKTAKSTAPKASAAIIIPPLKKGELWAGIILKDHSKPDYHLVKLPGQADKANFKGAADWAKKHGGEPPTLRDLALMRTNLRAQFQDKWYWSCEESRNYSDWAYAQDFANGRQYDISKDFELCAVAVRRVAI